VIGILSAMESIRLLSLLELAKDGSDYLDHAVARALGLRTRPVPQVTRSLDAALLLLPKEWIVHRLGQVSDCRGGTRGWVAEVCRVTDAVIPFPPDCIARTAPLALCMSALRALAGVGLERQEPAAYRSARR
jgi:hypothetical protein